MNPALRAIDWHHELYLLHHDSDATVAEFDSIVTTLLAEDDQLVTLRTLRTLMASPSLPRLANQAWKAPAFRKWITENSTNIFNFAETIELKAYTTEEAKQGLVDQ